MTSMNIRKRMHTYMCIHTRNREIKQNTTKDNELCLAVFRYQMGNVGVWIGVSIEL